MWTKIVEFLRSQGLSFLFFTGGAIVGFCFAVLIYFAFSRKKRKLPKGEKPKLTQAITERAVKNFVSANTKSDFKAKLKAFSNELFIAITDLSDEYYDEKVKRYPVVKQGKLFERDLSLPLCFTVYELLGFVDLILYDAEKIYDEALHRDRFLFVYKAYRMFTKMVDEKDPKDLTLSKVAEIVDYYKDKAEEPPKSISFIGKIVKGVVNKGVNFGVVRVVDDAAEDAIVCLVSDFNLLFSHNLRGGTGGLIPGVTDEEVAV